MSQGEPSFGLRHEALLYASPTEYLAALKSFVEEGLRDREAVMIALPPQKLELVRRSIRTSDAELIDMTELGRNPARVVAGIIEFVEELGRRPARVVCEMQWPSRSPAAAREAARTDVLLDLALHDYPLWVLCPYDTVSSLAGVIERVPRFHPWVLSNSHHLQSTSYRAAGSLDTDAFWQLEAPQAPPQELLHFHDLADVRHRVHAWASAAGLPPDRVDDLVLAVNEVASNSILHGGGGGSLVMWTAPDGSLVCDLSDTGQISDPLVGTRGPGPSSGATGLWLVNQLCDLVEIRSDGAGTCVRLTLSP
jgi:anti-sigma regulatory factor (Ser/Thr protein kinase)